MYVGEDGMLRYEFLLPPMLWRQVVRLVGSASESLTYATLTIVHRAAAANALLWMCMLTRKRSGNMQQRGEL